jgi:two-component system cell cycle sensor histidine kinase/response regulator CckA
VFGERENLVLVVGSDALLLHASAGWTRITGDTAEPELGRPVPEALRMGRLASADWEVFDHAFAAALREGSNVPIPITYGQPESGIRQLEGRLYRPGDREDIGVIVFHDATSRTAELIELVKSERRFRMIAEATRDMVTETDSKGRFTYVSPACTTVLGFTAEELLDQSPLDIHHEENRETFRREVISHRGSGQAFAVEPHRLRCKDGSWIWVEATGVYYRRPDGEMRVVGVARDITSRLQAERERQELEEQLHHSQKLESLGILAGGIAHDFNNYLTPIVGAAGLLEAELPDGSPQRSNVDLIRRAAARATDLTAQMLHYAGGTEIRLAPLDVSESIRDMRLLLQSAAGHRAELVYDLKRELPRVRADESQLAQVVMNLVVNATEAFGDSGGRIEIATGLMELDQADLRGYHLGEQCGAGDFVSLQVSDNGSGIDSERRQHIFDPFFSTKFPGRGLGLSVVLGIVKRHGGALRIDTTLGVGTRFRVLLPVASKRVDESRAESEESQRNKAEQTPSGTILVVDDDDGVRQMTTVLLDRAGFAVLSERDGAEAIETFRRNSKVISGVVLDSTMPGLSGTEVFDAIRKIDPEVPILLVSGYSLERSSEELLERGVTGFLAKPFGAKQLLNELRQLIASGQLTASG